MGLSKHLNINNLKIPVLLPNIFDNPFTYETDINLSVGDYVLVPFGKSKMVGVVWDYFEKPINKKFLLKKISKKLEIEPLNKKTIKFLNWFSEYNLVPKGMSLKLHILSNEEFEDFEDKEYEGFYKLNKKVKFDLTEEQKKVFKELSSKTSNFRVHLLQGVTGSGKTVVYFNSIKQKIDLGYQGLILLPEIGLTS